MSNFNQKGPMGEGPMTGRKMGRCTNFGAGRRKQSMQENENRENLVNDNTQEYGLGRGRGHGRRRSMRNRIGNDLMEQGQINGLAQNRRGRGMGMDRRFHKGIQE